MNYGLIDGDIVISTHFYDRIERGDMLVIGHLLDPKQRLYIKRCAALPMSNVKSNSDCKASPKLAGTA